jgi:hypothetical protein
MSRKYERTESSNQSRIGRTCIGPQCDRPVLARGMCVAHYHQYRRMGRLNPTREALNDAANRRAN